MKKIDSKGLKGGYEMKKLIHLLRNYSIKIKNDKKITNTFIKNIKLKGDIMSTNTNQITYNRAKTWF